MYISNLKQKFKELSKKDLVKSRLDEEDLYSKQLNYFNNFTGKSYEIANSKLDETDSLYLEIQKMKALNTSRLNSMKQENAAIIDREFSRII